MDNDKSGKRGRSIKDNIELIERFLEENPGVKIKGDTVYDGKAIGKMVIQLRSWIRTGKRKVSNEDFARLQELGVLENDREFLDDKINRLVVFVKKYPELWSGRKRIENRLGKIEDEKKREEVRKEFYIALNDYEYIYSRGRAKRLSKEQEDLLISSGVGKLFRRESDIKAEKEKLIYEFGIDEEIADKILRRYGNLESFKGVYKNALKDNKVRKVMSEDLYFKLNMITDFDLSSPDLVHRYGNYAKFIRDVYKIKDNIFVMDFDNVKNLVDNFLNELPKRESELLQNFYGINGKPKKTLKSLESTYNVTRQQLGNVRNNGINIFRESELFKKIGERIFLLDHKTKSEFIEKFFESHDVFYSDNPEAISEDKKKELLDIFSEMKQERNQKNKEYLSNRISNIKAEVEYDNSMLNTRISDLSLSYRVNHYLKISGIKTVRDWLLLSEEDKNNIQNLGERSIKEINEKLKEIGIVGNSIYGNEFDKSSENLGIFEIIEDEIQKRYLSKQDRQELLEMLRVKCDILDKNNVAYILERLDYVRDLMKQKPVENDEEALKLKTEELDLSMRAYNCLKIAKIDDVNGWVNMTERSQRSIRNLGQKSYDEICEKLRSLNLEYISLDEYHNKNISEQGAIISELDCIEKEINNMYFESDTKKYLLQCVRRLRAYQIAQKQNNVKPDENDIIKDESLDFVLEEKIEELKLAYSELRSKKIKAEELNSKIEITELEGDTQDFE